jgi:peptidoglycan/LPS O-acetylase OafA/YrhL
MARNESSPVQPGAQRRTAIIWWSLAAGSLLAGYADLVRGGETIAPILLVLGYCVLVPLAILKS